MIILTLRSDKPEAELGLYANKQQIVYDKWPAHRALGETLHSRIINVLKRDKKNWEDIEGLVAYQGPGSFTGLRIGMSVANALAASLEIPIVGATGDSWIDDGIKRLLNKENDGVILPEYGSPPHITIQKK